MHYTATRAAMSCSLIMCVLVVACLGCKRSANARYIPVVPELGQLGIGSPARTVVSLHPDAKYQDGAYSICLHNSAPFVDAAVVTLNGSVSEIAAGGWSESPDVIDSWIQRIDDATGVKCTNGVMRSASVVGADSDVQAKAWLCDECVIVLYWDLGIADQDAKNYGVFLYLAGPAASRHRVAVGNQLFIPDQQDPGSNETRSPRIAK